MSMMGELGPNGETYEPVIYPQANFSPEKDAEMLEKAMKGLGTDEKTLIQILCNRTAHERAQISKTYKSLYGKDLAKQLKSETSGDFGRVLRYLCLDPHMLRAKIIYDCLQGAGTDEHGLVEILCSATNGEIENIKQAYLKVLEFKGKDPNKRNLEKDVGGDTSGFVKRLLTAIIQAERKEPDPALYEQAKTQGVGCLINMPEAQAMARKLYEAGEGKVGTDESTFIRIIAHENVWQLAAIAQAYQEISKKQLREVIKSETSGDFQRALLSTFDFCLNRPATFAYHLNKAIKGAGTREGTLIRICCTRCDIDMKEIKIAYQQQYGKTLAEDIKGDTSGDFKKALLTLIGES